MSQKENFLLEKIKLRLSRFFSFFNPNKILPLRLFQEGEEFIFIFFNKRKNRIYRLLTKSEDGFSFITEKMLEEREEDLISQYPNAWIVEDKKKIMFFGDRKIQVAIWNNNQKWRIKRKPLIVKSSPVELGGVYSYKDGYLILFFEKIKTDGLMRYFGYFALIDKEKLQILWETTEPIWKSQDHWQKETPILLGSAMINEKIISYWYLQSKKILGIVHSGFFFEPKKILKSNLYIKRYEKNPIIKPKKENSWENFNTFNSAAFYYDKKVHLLYRAQGYDYISHIGYAVSSDGYQIEERLDHPIFSPTYDFETNKKGEVNIEYVSAGSFGGCEDPRVTLMGDRLYMIYVAFDGWQPPRLALTSILLKDFLSRRWLWEKPVLISPQGVIDKSGCLLPEKIKGKYVIFHRIFPNILIDFVDDLNFDGKSKWLKGQYQIKVREGQWDSLKIGIGGSPLKTKDGWLAIYYGVDKKASNKYHIGAMLLDLKNPTKVLYRSNQPILTPQKDYEMNGFKPGIAYPCGAVIIDNKLLVYYGAADSYVAVAEADLDEFIENLKKDQPLKLESIVIKEVII